MPKLTFPGMLLPGVLSILGLFQPAQAQSTPPLNLRWVPRQDLNVLLPPSVRVFETNGTLPDGARIRAMYTRIALADRNLRLRAVGEERGPAFRLKTTAEYAALNQAIWAVNGGYFGANSSASLVITDGNGVAPNQKTIPRNGRNYTPTRGAFGLVNRVPDVAWVYGLGGSLDGPDNTTWAYPNPSLNDPTQPPQAVPSPTFPAGGVVWNASQAVGGGPVLVHNSQVRVTAAEEIIAPDIAVGRNPRTAVGYLAGDTVIVVAVDGRQAASAGVTLQEMAQMLVELRVREGLNLDGGGSTTMLAAGEVVNNPTDRPGGDRNQLRSNASSLVLSEAVPSPRRPVIVIDTNNPLYSESGLWTATNHPSAYLPTASRGATVGAPGTKARYSLGQLPRGRYQLAAWWTIGTGNARRVPYVLHRGTRRDTLLADQNDLSTTARWNVLGTFDLAPGDYVELLARGQGGTRVIADALRLVELERAPTTVPPRGDLRIAVISDLNAALGSSTYEWQVDSIMQRIPRIWQPDLVVCGGDMVAGQGVSTDAIMRTMWQGFDRSVTSKFRRAGIPFAFTLGNHDGTRSLPMERRVTREFWRNPAYAPPLAFVDSVNYPAYYSFRQDQVFVVSWDASSDVIMPANLAWVQQQFSLPEARAARMRLLVGHLPLYSIAQERDGVGNVLRNNEALRKILERLDVKTYISGHHHAYFPGRRGDLELLNAGAAGSGPRPWLTLDKAPTNTITIMDVYYRQDSVAYTTYDILQRNAADMATFDPAVLPRIIYGYDGSFVVRRDLQAEPVAATLSPLHLELGRPAGSATATARAVIANQRVRVTGSFTNLASPLLDDRAAVAIGGGSHGTAGRLLGQLTVLSSDRRTGTFSGTLDAKSDTVTDQLRAGALFIRLRTQANPNGELRGQLYGAANQPPRPTAVSSTRPADVYAVRNLEALFGVSWPPSEEPDGDPVTYFYQLATDLNFNNIVFQEGTGRATTVRRREDAWYALLGSSAPGTAVRFYQRVLATDGKSIVPGPALVLQLTKSDEPLTDLVEVPAPDFRYDGNILPGANGYGATTDGFGKLWLLDYSGRLHVRLPNGQPASFSPLLNTNPALGLTSQNTGLGTDRDGHILISSNAKLVKINAQTGTLIASWTAPARAGGQANTLTTPRVDSWGRVFVASLWGDDYTYILRQAGATFRLVRRLTLPDRILSRAFAMEPDGLTLYLPDPGTAQIQRYTSPDTVNYTLAGTITSLAAGSSGVQVLPGRRLFAAVRAVGSTPASFHFRDETNQRLWNLPLPEVGNAEARGLGVSATGDTLLYCAWNNGGIHRYVRVQTGAPAAVSPIRTYRIGQLRPVQPLTGIADSAGVYCRLEGVVNSPNFRDAGLDFSLVDGDKAINVVRQTDNLAYPVRPGDRLRVIGRVVQENGLIRFQADSLRRLAAGQPLFDPILQTGPLADSTESLPVELRGVRLVDPAQWTTGQGYPGFGVDLQDEVRTYRAYIHHNSGLYQTAAPTGFFTLRGVVYQFNPEAPFLGGYELWPRSIQDLGVLLGTQGGSNQPAFRLHPNPTTGLLQVEAPSGEKLRQLEVLNLLGQRLYRESVDGVPTAQLRVSNLPPGIYLLRLMTNKQTATQRFEKL
ncbi:phosphodiester glycosidase family protein [Hymenobacter sp. BT664]|uniref:Phosphodiester glycosidase family protein n=1 Tax=Hymenobacter montanus TaxID=2771359 RepID=A0A927BFA4_9BACT|nr:phosphodiester glycosidase family protein [Hymenobacter montanus]MBD2769821.1 phosphodiester glycosidase family protein [Hymenobacter montanus]